MKEFGDSEVILRRLGHEPDFANKARSRCAPASACCATLHLSVLRQVVVEYGKDAQDSDFISIAGLIAHAWDLDESIRFQGLEKLFAKHQDNVKNFEQQGKPDNSAEMELWHPCVTFCFQ